MTAAEYRAAVGATGGASIKGKVFGVPETPARNKYGNRKVQVDGHTFDSSKEADRYITLSRLQRAGEIAQLEIQPKYRIEINGSPVLIRSKGFPNGRRASYRADFRYRVVATGETVVEDVKSIATATEADKLRRAVVEAIFGIRIVTP